MVIMQKVLLKVAFRFNYMPIMRGWYRTLKTCLQEF